MSQQVWIAAAAGVAVAAVSALIAWAALRWSAGRPQATLAAVLGGTLARLVVVITASLVLLMKADVHRGGYVTGLIVAYLVFLAAEIVFLARGGHRRRPDGGEEA